MSRHDTNTPSVPEAGRAGGTGTATEQSGSPGTGTGRTERDGRGHFDVVAACFVAFLLLSNIGATKLIGFNVTSGWHLVFDGGAVLFPFTYILGDVLSEVYGFANARRVILTGFVVQIIASLTFWLIQIAPGDHTYRNQAAYEAVLGQVPRMVAASLLGFLAGQLLNSLVLVRIKRRSGERRLWIRLLGSTVVGEAADSAVFCTVAWAGEIPRGVLVGYMITGFAYKVAVEALFLPVTYVVVGWVKRREPGYVGAEGVKGTGTGPLAGGVGQTGTEATGGLGRVESVEGR